MPNYKKIALSTLEKIVLLIKNENILYSEFNDRSVLRELEQLNIVTVSGRPKIVLLNNKVMLFRYLQKSNQFIFDSIELLQEYIDFEKNGDLKSKDEISKYQLTTKDSVSESFYGINIAVLRDTVVMQNNKEITLKPLHSGAYFFFQKDVIIIPEDTLVIGVENPQVVWLIDRYKRWFNYENEKMVFILINDYKNGYPFQWIGTIKGRYLHFGDFDISGLSIYYNKVYPRLERKDLTQYFIPEGIEEIINKLGNKKDFEAQKTHFDGVFEKANEKEKKLLQFIKMVGKSLEQEKLSIH